ncbi:hypothetical protein HanRHA438_Chr04g0177891 [Helianthus annuus]|nr:hypothetical protein HanHA300_Chr04g0138111 [Helianthus annuus]KAJ0597138.1 hypothetical protein HanHA89_Chr04g0151091 [Helianthus annuus]KAJ0757819.1 hypothetical protein HanLR1_Chr04g0143181 [Helianthus annuus]KAJ0761490.1 hypothetical protein HanOQP8_Chr04g0150461 [Helianthus annuus]KAJ0927012.1 hypothetical protein HanRHA438_Chr04g0177891 [Helianthus annuus]
MSFLENATRIEPESSSGLKFNVGGSSSGFKPEFEEHRLSAAEKMKFMEESDSDDDVDVDVDVDVAKLEKKFGREFAGEDDDSMNVEQRDRTTKERAAADAEREIALNKYLETAQTKKRKLPPKSKATSKC